MMQPEATTFKTKSQGDKLKALSAVIDKSAS